MSSLTPGGGSPLLPGGGSPAPHVLTPGSVGGSSHVGSLCEGLPAWFCKCGMCEGNVSLGIEDACCVRERQFLQDGEAPGHVTLVMPCMQTTRPLRPWCLLGG